MRWKFKFRFNYDFFLNSLGNIGVGLFTSGIISYVFNKSNNEILILTGSLTILLACLGKSIKIKK